MGRWAQRRRTGGGYSGAAGLISIIDATQVGLSQLDLTYNGVIDEADFLTSNFTTFASTFSPDTVSQNGPTGLTLVFLEDITGEGAIQYAGTAPGVLTPQTVAFP